MVLDAIALKRGYFGRGTSKPIYLDNVNCLGDEGQLLNCSANEIGFNNCGHSEDAGVICDGEC